ncbi:MAG: Rpn family recombination-promoting nuclease/putative transposase [Massilia sp.]
MSGDHDLGYKQLFGHPELVPDLLSGFTPFACFRDLGPAAFERVNASYVSEQFSERHGDMVWRVRLGGEWLYVYLLLEFQSQAERWMALRIQVYVGLLYQDLVKRHELSPDGKLPPVLPVVFYNGAAPWHVRSELRELVENGPSELDDFQASQRYLVIDQQRIEPEQLAGAKNLVAALFKVELSDSTQVLIDVLASLTAWLESDSRASLRRSINSWLMRSHNAALRAARQANGQQPMKEVDMGESEHSTRETLADLLSGIGPHELAVGVGRVMGKRSMLKRQLGKRFGTLSLADEARVDTGSEVNVDLWSERVLDADSIEEVFANT